MRQNYFKGFGVFFENAPERPGANFMHTLKQQLPINRRAFKGQFVVVPAGSTIGKYKNIKRPMTLYVDALDDRTVTLVPTPQDGINFDTKTFDTDGEMNLEPGLPTEREEFVMTHEEFDKLLSPEPQQQQGGMM